MAKSGYSREEGQTSSDLSEVRAILHQLQRFDFGVQDKVSTPLAHEQTPVHPGETTIQALYRKQDASVSSGTRKFRRARHVAYICILAICGYGGLSFFVLEAPPIAMTKKTEGEVAKGPDSAEVKLAEARRSLSEGDIIQARQFLMQIGPQPSADATFALAQSFDPNYLQTLPKANDAPNKQEAERWYKAWYELALQNGLKMDSERLQRIINAMH